MTQLSLLPIRLRDEFEADHDKSKDLLWTGIDEQDRRYALKTVEQGTPLLPLTEWICSHLCQLCSIPAPDFAVVTRIDGSLAFGSRWEEDADQYYRDEVDTQTLARWISECKDDVSAMFMLDCFLPNEDRHMGNLLFRRTPRRRALAFDWSRTRLFGPWPLSLDSATMQNLQWLKKNGLYSEPAAQAVLAKLAAISDTELRKIIQNAPQEWHSNLVEVVQMTMWWREHRHERIEALQK